MDKSLVVLVRLPRVELSSMPDKLNATSTTTTDDGHVMESPGHTSYDGETSDEQEEMMSLRRRAKKRKPTYTARKEEMAELTEELVTLREEMRKLKAQQTRFTPITTEERTHTASLRWQVTQSRLAIASAQSLVSSYTAQCGKPLLGDYIHLPRDPVERQQILEGMKTHKMNEAIAFLAARCQHSDLRRQARQSDNFEAANKDLISNFWAVAKIQEGHPTVRRVYDELLEFARTSEMAIAERFGLVSVRESEPWVETVDAKQVRVLTSYPPNRLVEKNHVVYSQYFPRSEALDQPHGVFICDYIDRDDVHPYQPHERIRKDVSSVYMVVECPATEPDELPVVVIINSAFKRIHHTHLATENELHGIAREGPRSYFDVMVDTIREKLACHV